MSKTTTPKTPLAYLSIPVGFFIFFSKFLFTYFYALILGYSWKWDQIWGFLYVMRFEMPEETFVQMNTIGVFLQYLLFMFFLFFFFFRYRLNSSRRVKMLMLGIVFQSVNLIAAYSLNWLNEPTVIDLILFMLVPSILLTPMMQRDIDFAKNKNFMRNEI